MFNSGSHSWLTRRGFKCSKMAQQVAAVLTIFAISLGLGWQGNQWFKASALQSRAQIILRQREDLDLRRAFEPRNFPQMWAANRWAIPMFATIVVNTTVDNFDEDGFCSLREAISAANDNMSVGTCTAGTAGPDIIQFNVGTGTPTINLIAPLPPITEPVTINGNTGGATRIELNGAGAGAGANGLEITAGSTTIGNLVINRFSNSGIRIQTNGGNTIQGCFIGTNAAGTAAQSNGLVGIFILSGANNIIGGTGAGQGNLISGNGNNGIDTNSNGNSIQGNLIGVDLTGTADLGNGADGVFLGGMNNTLGGTTAAARNIISGNNTRGVFLGVSATGSVVQGNYIGTNAAGTAAIGNALRGVEVLANSGNTIGGTAAGAGNVISGNGNIGLQLDSASNTQVQGNLIGTSADGTAAIPNILFGVTVRGSNNTIGGTSAAARNVISGNSGDGLLIEDAASTGNLVQGNFIGLNSAGSMAIANTGRGVNVFEGAGNAIGGTAAGAGNVISGNALNGIEIASGAAATVQGNLIGLDAMGLIARPNGQDGVLLAASGRTIGGTASAARNVISGNTGAGVRITGGSNNIQGNLIGTNLGGTAAVANVSNGVVVTGANNTIGGAVAGAGNVISGNGVSNVAISGGSATGNQVQGNFIGLNAAGTMGIGSTTDGVAIDSAPANTVGGTVAAARNIISGHIRFGINIFGAAATGNAILGNFIGLDVTGTINVSNSQAGLAVSDTTDTLIGGTAVGAGNVISGNLGAGIDLFSGSNTQIQGNLIGTNSAGTTALGNGFDGINLRATSGNTVGGTTAAARNVISGNGQSGINILSLGTGGNTIQGNYIGIDLMGTTAIANAADGVMLGAPNNLLGGTSAGARNVISGNSNRGVSIQGAAAANNQVQGNFIGLNAAGTMKIANQTGFIVLNAPNNFIGGTAAGAGNVISGNNGPGLMIEGSGATGNQVLGNLIGANPAGTAAIGNMNTGVEIISAEGNIIGGTAAGARNVISGNGSDQSGGVLLSDGAANNQVVGNFIGTDITGAADVGNSLFGVRISNSSDDNTVGGTIAAARNVISGNNNDGVQLFDATTTGNQVLGNYIGLNAAGTAAIPNSSNGVNFNAAANNTIGGTASGAGNVISGNSEAGISMGGGASGNQVQGNLIGTNAAGTAALPNGIGVGISGAPNTILGGMTSAARNIISGNLGSGVLMLGSSAGAQVFGNYIGTNPAGTAALGNGGQGMNLSAVTGVMVGGTASGAGNLISGNANEGIRLTDGSISNTIQGNFIGTNSAGTAGIANSGAGIVITGSGALVNTNNTIGGTAAGAGNLIAFNSGPGINFSELTENNANNRIQGNAIHSNSSLGIDLGSDGVTANDAGDPDAGANHRQNFPVLTAVSSTGMITGSLDSLPANSAYPVRIEFFANTACDGLGHGEGEISLGFTTLAAPGSFSFPAQLVPGKNFITATATDNDGNTSEFSACQQVNAAPTIAAASPISRQQGSPGINSQLATVADADQSAITLTVTATQQTGTGVNISNISIDNAGLVQADIVASCTAANSTFMLTVTDATGETATASLIVNVTPNTPPSLGSYPNTNIMTVGSAATVMPSAAPTDIAGAQSISASAPGFTGIFAVDNTTGVVTVTNAGPAGVYTVTVSAFDSCGATSTATFMLAVGCPGLTVNDLGDALDIAPGNGVCATSGSVCTLRAAIQEANALACGTTINFNVNGTIQLGSALPNLTANMTINGPGANLLTVRRNTGGNYRIFTNNAGQTVTINGLTIQDGNAGGFGTSGGGIFNNGSLTLNGCVVKNNAAGTGAGIYNDGGSLTILNTAISGNNASAGDFIVATGGGIDSFTGTLTLTNSTISGNMNSNPLGDLQGSAMNLQDVTATLTNCTISGNTDGSTIVHLASGLPSMLTMTNCTVANNRGDSFSTIDTSSGSVNPATTQLRNTLVAGNTGQPNFRTIGNATLTSLGNNLDSDGSSGFTNGVGGNLVGASGNPINAHLVPLADNGGATQTHALRCDSPAIDAGTATGAPATDQRGLAGNADGNGDNTSAVDIGAFEVQKLVVTTVANSGAGSLRQAIIDNNNTGGALIAFNLPGAGIQTIAPLTSFSVFKTVSIDGYTQPGASRNTLAMGNNAALLIELNGAGAGSGAGMVLTDTADCSCVRGLAVNRYFNAALIVQGDDNWINGNFLGTNVAGTAALGNQSGLSVTGDNSILGTNADGVSDPAERNLISGNTSHGIALANSANRTFVAGNYIGTNASGTADLGNSGNGVAIMGGADNSIGFFSPNSGNVIAFNGQNGVTVSGNASAIRNLIQGNSIFSNVGLGIDLGDNGLTSNDPGDPDMGPNNLQNFPILTSVTSDGTINGSLDSLGGNSIYPVRIEFFGNATCDSSGNGEGQGFLGEITINAPGAFSFSAGSLIGLFGNLITATATDSNSNTSEFSACRAINTAPVIAAIANDRRQGSSGTNSQIATVADPDQPLNTLTVQVNGGTSATVNGVSVSNLAVSSGGQVTADIIAGCTAANASFTLRVTDGTGEFSTATLSVTVTPNTPPVLSYASPQTVMAGQSLTVTPATGPMDNGSIASLVLQSAGSYTGGITVNPTTGDVTLTGALPPGSHTIIIRATDNCGAPTDASFTLNVNCPVITVNPASLPGGTVGMGYSQTISATPAGTYMFTVSSGSLPPGLTLNPATGALTGTPTQANTFNFTITATSFGSCTGSRSYAVTIACPAITVNPPSLADGTTGTVYSQTITAAGGTSPYAFAVSSGALPAGVALSSGGSLSGTPTQSGTFSFTVTATDAFGCTGSRAYTLVVGCPPFALTVNQPAAVNAGQNLNVDVTVTNPCPDVALSTTLTTATPPNTTFQSITIPAGWMCSTPPPGGIGTITCTNNSFAPRPAAPVATAVFNIVFLVSTATPSGAAITTNINVTGTAPGRPTITASASASSTVSQQADLVMSNSAPGTIVAGTTMNYSYNITNVGDSAASNVSFSTALPPGTVFVSNTVPAGFTCTTPAVNANGIVACTAPALASGTGDGFIITVRINENAACNTVLTNIANVTSATPDPNATNNISTVETIVQTQSDLSVNVVAPATAAPDTSAIYTVTVTNAGPSSSVNTTLNNALPPAFSAEAITPSTGTCTGLGTNTVNCNLGTLAAGATATITIQAHVPETCQPSTAVNTATVSSGNCLADPAPANNMQTRMTSVAVGNAGPGSCLPAKTAISSTKPGSLIFAGLFTSGATGGTGGGDSNQNNTRVNLTNTHPTMGVIVHLFFVDGATCSIADAFLCLTANQTTSFFMSDLDPGTSGYMMMVAVDGPAGFAGGHNTGCPISFNYLIGNANIKFVGSPRRDLDLGGESAGSEFGSPVPNCDPNSSTAELIFDGSPQGYNQLPAVLAMDNIQSRADGNETLLMFARIDGNWGIGLEPIGPIAGILYDDTEKAHSFSFNVGSCLFRSGLSNSFPRTTPRFEQAIPAGRSGWMKFWSANGAALVGAMHTRNDNSQISASAFEGGHNLHVLRLLPRAVITVPVFPPSC